jgi:hypothetical protein
MSAAETAGGGQTMEKECSMNEPSSDAPGAQRHPRAAREFAAGNGKVSYCTDCRRVAVEFAAFHLLFHRTGYDGFLSCLQEALRDLPDRPPGEKIRIGPKDRQEHIDMEPDQIVELALLMEMGAMIMDAELPP